VNRPSPREDFNEILRLVTPGARVLDVGCGEGALLELLTSRRQVDGRGLEISPEGVSACLARGLAVMQGDADRDLGEFPAGAFDYAILSQTLQAVLRPRHVLGELLRIARRAIVSFPNFGHWEVRRAMLFTGQAPKTKLFPYDWYNSPNIHFLSINDFEELCRESGFPIEKRYFLAGARRVTVLPNLLAQTAVFLLG